MMTLVLDGHHHATTSSLANNASLILIGQCRLSSSNSDEDSNKENTTSSSSKTCMKRNSNKKPSLHHRETSPTTVIFPTPRHVRFNEEIVTHLYDTQEGNEECNDQQERDEYDEEFDQLLEELDIPSKKQPQDTTGISTAVNARKFRAKLGRAFQEQSYDLLLRHVYQTPLSHLQAFALLPETNEDGVPNLRGLEQYASPYVAFVRHEHRRRMRQAALDRAYILRVENQCSKGQQGLLLADFCRRYSQPAVQFARNQGTADRVAACQPDTNVFAFHLVHQLWQNYEQERRERAAAAARDRASCHVLPQYHDDDDDEWNPAAWIWQFLGVADLEPLSKK